MKRKYCGSSGIAIILLLIIAAFIVKQVNGSGKKTVKVTIHIQLRRRHLLV